MLCNDVFELMVERSCLLSQRMEQCRRMAQRVLAKNRKISESSKDPVTLSVLKQCLNRNARQHEVLALFSKHQALAETTR